jgi:hypothetical protein
LTIGCAGKADNEKLALNFVQAKQTYWFGQSLIDVPADYGSSGNFFAGEVPGDSDSVKVTVGATNASVAALAGRCRNGMGG